LWWACKQRSDFEKYDVNGGTSETCDVHFLAMVHASAINEQLSKVRSKK